MNNLITIYKNIKAVSSGFNRDVYYALNRIKEGKSLSLINQIRLEPDHKKRSALKQQLPSICFSGTFKQRNDASIIQHSGLICLDFDKFPNDEQLNNWRASLISNEYTFSLFTSPSGKGIKVLVRIPPEKENHQLYFKALSEYFNCPYLDEGAKSLSMATYESYDPNLFINENALVWVQKEEEVIHELGSNVGLKLINENRIVTNILTWWKNKFGKSSEGRNNNVFKLASAFNDFGIHKNECENILFDFVEKDFTKREIEIIIKSAYKKTSSFGTKFFEDKQTKEKIERHIRAGYSIKKIQELLPDRKPEDIEEAANNIKESLSVTEFWVTDENGKIKMKPSKYKEYLEQQGFCKIYPSGADNFIFVKVEENLIDNTMASHIKDQVLEYLYTNTDFGLGPYDYISGAPKYFKDDYLSLINTTQINIKEDTPEICYLYFKNCAVEITKDAIKEIDYIELQGFVWKKQIIDRPFKKFDSKNSIFKKFMWLISGKNEQRYNSLRSVAGYLMHSYKSASDNKAIILNDEVISENPNGGSGKGIFCNAISKMKNVATIDGKQFDFNKSFAYQTVGADTQILVFDDVKKNFAFENLFSLVTEGITLEKKNKDAIKLPINKSPKIVITTNYTVGGMGGSFERRKFEVELSSYFGVHWTPLQEFGHTLFDDWNEQQYMEFDNFQIECIQYYLEHGLIKHEYQNLEVRKFIKETSFEFHELMKEEPLKLDERIYKTQKFNEFIDEYPDFKKYLSQKKFSQWIESYAKFKGLTTEKGKDPEGRWVVIKSNINKDVSNQQGIIMKNNDDNDDIPF